MESRLWNDNNSSDDNDRYDVYEPPSGSTSDFVQTPIDLSEPSVLSDPIVTNDPVLSSKGPLNLAAPDLIGSDLGPPKPRPSNPKSNNAPGSSATTSSSSAVANGNSSNNNSNSSHSHSGRKVNKKKQRKEAKKAQKAVNQPSTSSKKNSSNKFDDPDDFLLQEAPPKDKSSVEFLGSGLLSTLEELRQQANHYYNDGFLEEARIRYETALSSLQQHSVLSNGDNNIEFVKEVQCILMLNTSATRCRKGQHLRGLQSAQEAIELGGKSIKALYRRALCLQGLKDFEGAERDVREAIKLYPGSKTLAKLLDSILSEKADHLKTHKKLESPLNEKTLGIGFYVVTPSLEQRLVAEYGKEGVIPRYHFQDTRALVLMSHELPVILTNSTLYRTAVDKWTLPYLKQHLTDPRACVYVNDTGDNLFRYYSDENMNSTNYDFERPTKLQHMSFAQFLQKVEESKKSDSKTSYYLQEGLSVEGVDKQLLSDFQQFDFPLMCKMKQRLKLGDLKTSTLWVGPKGVITPSHYDEAHNFYGQVRGTKKFILHNPKYFDCMYPFPIHHPHDRQSMVDIRNPDLKLFPRFPIAQEHAVEAVISPGEVLYLPPYWFHQVEALEDTIACNLWFKTDNTQHESVQFPLSKQSLIMSFRRNIEKFVGEAMGPRNVGVFLKELYQGRFDQSILNNITAPANADRDSTSTNADKAKEDGQSPKEK